jgi:hypothetical protein
MALVIDRSLLDSYLAKNIKDICEFKNWSASSNHCAHFVSHVLQLHFGYTCDKKKDGAGYNVRVKEVWERCHDYASFDAGAGACLVYATKAGNVDLGKKSIANVSDKHIGIFTNGAIWHYDNTLDKVVSQTPEEFLQRKTKQYGKGTALFRSDFPDGASPKALAS